MGYADTKSNIMFRMAIPRELHKKLKIKSVEMDTTMNEIIVNLIQDWLTCDEKPEKKRFSIQGMSKGGQPIPKEAFDEVNKEWEKE